MKVEKCEFFSKNMELLGFEIIQQGVGPMTSKLQRIKEMKVLPTKTSIKSFLGLVRYYQRFVPCLAEKAVPFQAMLKKDSTPKDWGPPQQKAVEEIKEAFINPMILRHYDPTLRTILQTDASDYAMGAVLSQITEEGREWVVSFTSKSLDTAQRNYSVTEKECLAVVWGTEYFRTLLLGVQFELQTDHQALKYLLTSKEGVGRNARWQLKLQEYDMVVT